MVNRAPYQPYQPPAYRGQGYGQGYTQGMYQPMPQQEMTYQQPGMINARYVSCREEAVAAAVMPDGNVYLFVDSARGRIYAKSVDPNTGYANFREYGAIAPQEAQAPQWVPIDAFQALLERVKALEAAAGREETVQA